MLPRGYESFDLLSEPQKQIYGLLQQALMGQLQPQTDERFSAPYLRQFQEQIVPQLAERFAGLGAGSQSSSAFQQALGSSGADLAERLASLNVGQQLQREQMGLSGLQNLLGVQTRGLVQKSRPWWQELLLGASGGLGSSLGGSLFGGISSGIGALGRLFGGNKSQFGTEL